MRTYKLATLFAALFVPFVLGSAGAAEPEATSPHLWASNAVVLTARGLTPGTRYGTTFQALSADDDPNPYCLGGQVTVGRSGYVRLDTDLADLVYGSGRPVTEVKVWLREPGSACDAQPALDQDGLPLMTELDLY